MVFIAIMFGMLIAAGANKKIMFSLFGGGTGAGVSVQPVAFLVVGKNQMKLLPVDEGSNALGNLFDLMGKLACNLTNKDNKEENTANTSNYDSTVNPS